MQSIFFLGKTALSPALSAANPSIILVPGDLVLLLTANLPATSRTKLRQALPYALEEYVLEDVDALHFAAGERSAAGEIPVAVVSKKVMQTFLEQIAQLQLQPVQLLPLTLALPFHLTTWHIFIADIVYVRTGVDDGFTCDAANLAAYLQLALDKAVVKPEHIHLHRFAQVEVTLTLPAEITVLDQREVGDFYERLADFCENLSSLNLLQNEFAVKKAKLRPAKSLTRYSLYLGATFMALLSIYPVVSYCLLESQKQALESQVAQIYHRYYPERKTVAAPLSMLQTKWQQAVGNGGDPALTLLAQIGAGLTAVKGISIQRLDYQLQQLTMQIAAKSPESFADFTDQLNKQGLTVKQQNADLGGGSVHATLIIAE